MIAVLRNGGLMILAICKVKGQKAKVKGEVRGLRCQVLGTKYQVRGVKAPLPNPAYVVASTDRKICPNDLFSRPKSCVSGSLGWDFGTAPTLHATACGSRGPERYR